MYSLCVCVCGFGDLVVLVVLAGLWLCGGFGDLVGLAGFGDLAGLVIWLGLAGFGDLVGLAGFGDLAGFGGFGWVW